jgi:uncharacterized membrane protein YkoI
MKLYKALLSTLLISIASIVYAEQSLPLTKETAATQVQAESGGKVLSVDDKTEGSLQIFRIKVLHDDGKIKIYQLDAATGKKVE